MSTQPRRSLRFAIGAGLASALAVGIGATASYWYAPTRIIPSTPDLALIIVGLLVAPCLSVLALLKLREYREQTGPSRERSLATWAVGTAVAPSVAAVAGLALAIVLGL